tara:strand:+ start:731 stop:958 length:228 start_codon:yes stop_codon:yes gene_type:complete
MIDTLTHPNGNSYRFQQAGLQVVVTAHSPSGHCMATLRLTNEEARQLWVHLRIEMNSTWKPSSCPVRLPVFAVDS